MKYFVFDIICNTIRKGRLLYGSRVIALTDIQNTHRHTVGL